MVTRGRAVRRSMHGEGPAPDAEKPAVLKAYLDRFKLTVQRYFPVRAGSPTADFVTLAPRYPVFELIPTARPNQRKSS